MGIDQQQIREYIIRPALIPHGMWTKSSEELLMLTGAKESQLGYYIHQLGAGPALGLWQVEPDTFDWMKVVFPSLLANRTAPEMVYDLRLNVLVARLRYYVDPQALPHYTDVAGMAEYWKRIYNTTKGKGTVAEAIASYNKYVLGKGVKNNE